MSSAKLPKITIVGEFQNGKSTLVNCLLGAKYAPTGHGCRTTSCCTHFLYGETNAAPRQIYGATPSENYLEVTCNRPILKDAILIDTPGFDASKDDDETAKNAIRNSDIIIFVQGAQQLGERSFQILKNIRDAGKRMLFLMNCKDLQNWSPKDKHNMGIANNIEHDLFNHGISSSLISIQSKKVWPVNPIFALYTAGQLEKERDFSQGTTKRHAIYLLKNIQILDKNKEQLYQESAIPEVRRVIEEAAIMPLKELCKNMEQELQALTERWTSRLRKIISDSEELLKK